MPDIPKFGYPRRIDIVDAVNELGGAVEAALAEGGGGGGGGSYTLPVAGDSTLGGVKGKRVAEKDGNGRIVKVTPDGTAFIDAADALNPGVVRSKKGNAFADTDANVAVNAHGYMKCDAPKAYVDEQVAGVDARIEAFESDAETVTVSEQLVPGTVSALAYGKTVCIEFGGVNVAENVKTKVGSVAAKYAPRTSKTGTLVAAAGNEMISAYCKVETDGSIYINPVMPSGKGYIWVGTFTYLI